MAALATAELRRAREHYERRAWTQAFDALAAADRASALCPEDLERLATAAYLARPRRRLPRGARPCTPVASACRRKVVRRTLRVLARPAALVPRRDGPRDGMAGARRAADEGENERLRRARLSCCCRRRRSRCVQATSDSAYSTRDGGHRDRGALRRSRLCSPAHCTFKDARCCSTGTSRAASRSSTKSCWR